MENDSAKFDAARIRHTGVAYEARDLSHHAVFVFLLFLGCGVFLVLLATWGIFRDLGKTQYAGHQTTNPIMTSSEQLRELGGDPTLSFPMPRLQPNDVADMNKFRLKEEERLNSYGWTDPSKNRIHIPIERALDVLGAAWPQQQETLSMGGASSRAHAPAPQDSQTEKGINDDRNGNYGW